MVSGTSLHWTGAALVSPESSPPGSNIKGSLQPTSIITKSITKRVFIVESCPEIGKFGLESQQKYNVSYAKHSLGNFFDEVHDSLTQHFAWPTAR
jgi:hypothetical protein